MSPRRSARLNAISLNWRGVAGLKDRPHTTKVVNGSRKRKSVMQDVVEKLPIDMADSPSTPKKKKRATTSAPPITPTPAAIGLMSVPYSPGDVDGTSPPPPKNLLADPNATNAPLISLETSRLVTNKTTAQVSSSKVSNIKTTTGNILDEAIAHLIKTDPRLKPVIEQHPCQLFSPGGLAEEVDPFMALASGIISQQVSGAAAKSIKTKFVALFNPNTPSLAEHTFPTPTQVSSSTIEVLRTAGLSQRKAEYIHGLAQKFACGDLTTSMLFSASYDEVLEKLTAVRGLGRWSVEMFACFGLKRMDVFSTGDLGVQRGMAALVGRDVGKLKTGGKGKWKYMSEKDMEEMAERFRPYRSVFMWYMWKVENVDISTFDN